MRVAGTFGATLAVALLMSAADLRGQTLAESIEQAWSRDPVAAALDAREEEARARADLAARFVPGAPSASVAALDDRLHRDDGAQKWEMEVGVPLWLPGQRSAHQAEARARQDELAARRASLRWAIAGEVRTRWWSLAGARAARDLALRRVDTARALESDVLRRFESGDLARFDANLAQAERLSAEADAVQAQALVQAQEAGLRAITGTDAPSVLAGETVEAQVWSLEDHPQWQAWNAAVRVAAATLLATAKSDRAAPHVALRMERDRGGRGEPFSNAIGVQVSIPFSWEPQVRQQTAAARAERARVEAELAATRLRLQAGVESTRAALDAAERRLAIARAQRLATADNLQLAERSFSLGETDLTSLLRVRSSAFEAQLLEARQRIAVDAARSQLNQALGVVP